VAHALLDDIDKDTVDFQENYDGSEREPKVLPARFPNLLVNGAGGIAVGMATNIPPHNLGEVSMAAIAIMDNPAMTLDRADADRPGPDFPTGASILGQAGIRRPTRPAAARVMRGKVDVEPMRKDREAIIVTRFPIR
jgi:DNA gyrase subunit A